MATPTPNPRPPASDIPITADGSDNFMYGMDSYSSPFKLIEGEYQSGMNVVNRGGFVQTRPGSESLYQLPPGLIQGCTIFHPSNQVTYQVFAVSGSIYVSQEPFQTFTKLANIQFNPYSKFIAWASCIQSTTYDNTGTIQTLATPQNVLIMQDGNTRAAFWDGTNNGHINPTVSPGTPQSVSITAASNASPIVLTLQTPLIASQDEQVTVSGIAGNTAANGMWTITIIDATHVSLNGSTGNGSTTGTGVLGTLVTNPVATGAVATIEGFDGTPIGLWMVWSNNRLWVSRGTQVFASDIGNPLKFTEGQYLANVRYFVLPGDECTGAIETPDRTGVIFFTSEMGVFFQSSIQDRTQWNTTTNFQYNIFPNIGCVSPRSLVQQHGLLWWFSQRGLVSQNTALNVNVTSRVDVQDNEMIQSKANLSYDLSGVCGSFIENYLFHAVPNGDILNTRLHVLDQAPFDGKMDYWRLNSWNSYWTGWRPVEFCRYIVGTKERVFCVSNDYDGVGRMWELFRSDQTDNGIPITCFMITKTHIFGNRDYKKFRYIEVEMNAIRAETAVMVGVAGIKGTYQPVLVKDINAMVGQIYSDGQYGYGGQMIAGSQAQTRVIRSQDGSNPSDCNSACIESQDHRGLIDKGFSAIICWSGIAGVSSYRIFVQNEPIPYQGTCEQDETSEILLLNQDGCGSNSLFSTSMPFPQYCTTCSYVQDDTNGNPVSATVTQASFINQQDADRKALATAMWYVENQLGQT